MKTKSLLGVIGAMVFAAAVVGPGPAYARMPQSKKAAGQAQKNESVSPQGCALVPLSLLDKLFGEQFDHEHSLEQKSPPPYDGAWGWHCEFFSQPPFSRGHQTTVDFTVYVEASDAEAKQNFDKIAAFTEDKSKPAPPGLGDKVYWQTADKKELVLYVLKGKTHYSVGGDLKQVNEKDLVSLAKAVSAQL